MRAGEPAGRTALRTEDPGDLEGRTVVLPEEPVLTRDTQLALWTIYELSYRGFDDVDDNSSVRDRGCFVSRDVHVRVCPDGPILVRGADEVLDERGEAHPVIRPVVAVCACGRASRHRGATARTRPSRRHGRAQEVSVAVTHDG